MMWPGEAGPMTQPSSLHGVLVPLITPFGADGQVAAGALETLASEVLDAGATGIVALGTTGEATTLDAAEKRGGDRGLCRSLRAAGCGPGGWGRIQRHPGQRGGPRRPGALAADHRCAGAGAVLHQAG